MPTMHQIHRLQPMLLILRALDTQTLRTMRQIHRLQPMLLILLELAAVPTMPTLRTMNFLLLNTRMTTRGLYERCPRIWQWLI